MLLSWEKVSFIPDPMGPDPECGEAVWTVALYFLGWSSGLTSGDFMDGEADKILALNWRNFRKSSIRGTFLCSREWTSHSTCNGLGMDEAKR